MDEGMDPDFFPMMLEQALGTIESNGHVPAALAPMIKELALLCGVQLPPAPPGAAGSNKTPSDLGASAANLHASRRVSITSFADSSALAASGGLIPPALARGVSNTSIFGMINVASEAATSDTGGAGGGGGAAESGAESSASQLNSPTTPADGDSKKVIPMRACVVCGQVRAGEQRKAGFKCYMHIGVPSSATFVSRVEELDFLDVRQFQMEKTPLGKGSFGRVHRATHIASGQKFAVKVLDRVQLERMKMLHKIEAEIHILKQLSHPNIVKIYAVAESHDDDEDSAKLHIMMEFLEGGQLCHIDDEGKVLEPMPLIRMKKYLLGMAVGLQYMHEKGFVHRDIKPENVLIDRKKDCVKLTDFGVSSDLSADSSTSGMGTVEGSPAFMPPELFQSSDRSSGLDAMTMGRAQDVWSTGITAFVMAFGFLPFFGKSRSELTDQVLNKPLPFPPDADPVTVDLIRLMLTRDVYRRCTIPDVLQHPFFKGVRIVKGIPVEADPISIRMREFPVGVQPNTKVTDMPKASESDGDDEDCTVFLPPGVLMPNDFGNGSTSDAGLAQWTKAQAAFGRFVNEALSQKRNLELVVGSTYSVTLCMTENEQKM